MKNESEIYCKKITFGDPQRPNILLGLIEEDKEYCLIFKTASQVISIGKNFIISIKDTKEIFKGGSQ